MRTKILLAAGWLLMVSAAFAGEPVPATSASDAAQESESEAAAPDRLLGILSGIDSLQADFRQLTRDAGGSYLQEQSGVLIVARPDRLYWRSSAPDVQELVSDGRRLWFYDPELEQVTVQAFTPDLEKTPALILNGDVSGLHSTFDLDSFSDEIEDHLILVPRSPDAVFRRLVISFEADLPSAITVDDALGQQTTIRLSEVSVGGVYDEDRFTFIVPEGVDIVGDPTLLERAGD